MKSYLRAAAIAALTGILSAQAFAASVESLVQAGKYQQAYQQGLNNIVRREGDPAFDYAFGVASLKSGHPGDALFAFDRILVLEPGHVEARIGLAEALIALDNEKQARIELQVAGKSRLSPAQRQRVNRLLAETEARAMAKRDQVRVWGEFDFGHDSNVNSGADENFFVNPAFPGFPVTLNNDVQKQQAWFHQTGIGASAIRKLDDSRSLDVIARIRQRENMGEDDFDTRDWKLNGGYSVNHKGDIYRIALRYEQDDVNNDRLRYLWGILGQKTFMGRQSWNRGWQHTLVTGLARVDYISAAGKRDVNQVLIGMVGRKEIGDFRHTLRGYYVYEQAEDISPNGRDADHNGRELYILGWRADYLDMASLAPMARDYLPGLARYLGNMTPYADLGITRAHHNNELSAAQTTRDDFIYDIKLGLDWKWDRRLSFRAQYQNRWTDSNINVFEYDRQVLEFGVRYNFMM